MPLFTKANHPTPPGRTAAPSSTSSSVKFPAALRQKLATKGQAMPGGGYPIRNRAELADAIKAFGRAKDPAATKAYIIRRAFALGATDMLPASWGSGKGTRHLAKKTPAPLDLTSGPAATPTTNPMQGGLFR